MDQSNGKHRKPSLDQASSAESSSCGQKRKLYAIEEHEEQSEQTEPDVETETAYDADVDEVGEQPPEHQPLSLSKLASEREVIYELFQPWALKTYGDQAKTKTITLRKKVRILKALEGKEHSRPDSSKFRFWVKTKGFTTKRPEGFEEAPGSRRRCEPLSSTAVLSDNPGAVDLFAASKSKDFGRRIYRKVACVEEFFDIIYNVHMELGGRSGMHAGQKRTYRIITETYAFLPREAVTRFLTICPECKKNLRPSSPSAASKDDLAGNESSSEVEAYLNYSSHTESSLEAGPTAKRRRHSSAELKAHAALAAATAGGAAASSVSASHLDAIAPPPPTSPIAAPLAEAAAAASVEVGVPKIRVKPQLQRPLSPPLEPQAPPPAGPQLPGLDLQLLKSQDNLVRYYDFMRRFYAGGSLLPQPVLAPPLYGSSLLQSLSYPTAPATTSSSSSSSTTTTTTTSTTTASKATPAGGSSSPPQATSSGARSPTVTPTASAAAAATAPHTPINLTKSSFSSSSNGQPPTTSTPLSAAPLKLELPSPPKTLPLPLPLPLSADLRIPQVLLRGGGGGSGCGGGVGAGSTSTQQPLPPLDLERLKPITSTYLQLTRSMGLSDEDALRFDNLVSKDFKYTL
ncbi:proline-rich protein 36 isoform X3 [Drosophila mojavensis]|uniref:proline-rich protein 36 isoform X3 n=1 Tax=Drosophila mojavensis TaxID=7230 RepID=UPI00017C8834|nr:proline-rich protein 36 isoform X3 [Drosophila mojavensis]